MRKKHKTALRRQWSLALKLDIDVDYIIVARCV